MSPALALARSRVMLFSDGNITSRFWWTTLKEYRILLGSKKVSFTPLSNRLDWKGKSQAERHDPF